MFTKKVLIQKVFRGKNINSNEYIELSFKSNFIQIKIKLEIFLIFLITSSSSIKRFCFSFLSSLFYVFLNAWRTDCAVEEANKNNYFIENFLETEKQPVFACCIS